VELEVVVRHGFPEGRGLDLGCGDGKLMRILLDAAQAAPQLVGIDIDPLETRDAERSGVYRKVHTVPGDGVPEADAAFDFVFSNSVLEHIDDLEPVFAEVARLLRPGGSFVFTVPSDGFHDCLAGPLWGDRAAYLSMIDRRCAHRRYWSAGEWQECLERHGMRLALAEPYLSAAEVRRWETLSRYTAGVLYALAGERTQPIDLQRALHLRRPGLRLPDAAAAALASVVGADVSEQRSDRFGCLLVEGRRAQ
jgi:SAM-dependent methyltransferase